MNLLFIALGGAFGSAFRYLTIELITKNIEIQKFPLGVFFVNIFGCLLAGIFYFFLIKHFNSINLHFKNFVLIGFLGGFTTFSAFSLDFFRLFTAEHFTQAFAYAIFSVILSILAMFFGFYFSKLIFS